jgi:hypothetical protein
MFQCTEGLHVVSLFDFCFSSVLFPTQRRMTRCKVFDIALLSVERFDAIRYLLFFLLPSQSKQVYSTNNMVQSNLTYDRSRFCARRWSSCGLWRSVAEDRDSMFLRNVGIYLQVYTASQPRRPTSSSAQPCEPQISHKFWSYLLFYRFIILLRGLRKNVEC